MQKIYNVGSKILSIKDEENALSFSVFVQYPTIEKPTTLNFGPYALEACSNGAIAIGQFPVAILSHGNSSSPLVYRTISSFLAKNGIIVAGIEHYGNNRNNNDLEHDVLNLKYRPKHVRLTIDHLLKSDFFSESIRSDCFSVIGHSFGGYTGLAVSGGQPWTQNGIKITVENDHRIKALVLMAPAAGYFFPEDSLSEIKIPILLFEAEHDNILSEQWSSAIVLKGIRDQSLIQFNRIQNAGHFSFLSPFPPQMNRPDFLPSTDPQGFNREEFHTILPEQIMTFLKDVLKF